MTTELERIVRLKRDALVMANARRLIKARKATSNAKLYMELFGTGFSTARQCCSELGVNPDGNITNYSSMAAQLEAKFKPPSWGASKVAAGTIPAT